MSTIRDVLPPSQPLPADLVQYVDVVPGEWTEGIEYFESQVEQAVEAGGVPYNRLPEVYAALYGEVLAQEIACVAESLNEHPQIATLDVVLRLRRAAIAAFLAALDDELRGWDWEDEISLWERYGVED